MPALFAALADDFVQHGDDLHHLIRVITATRAYQLSPAVAERAPKDRKSDGADAGTVPALWSHFHVTPLGPDELLRSILDVTNLEDVLERRKANLDRIRFLLYQRYSFLFDVDEDFEQTAFEGTVAQALALLNGELVGGGTTSVQGSALDTVLKMPRGDGEKVTALYVRTVTRSPSEEELAYWTKYVTESHPVERLDPALEDSVVAPPGAAPRNKKGGPDAKGRSVQGPPALRRMEWKDNVAHPDARHQAYSDLLWALLNSTEFTFNH
jgi:hypothetical protein